MTDKPKATEKPKAATAKAKTYREKLVDIADGKIGSMSRANKIAAKTTATGFLALIEAFKDKEG